MNAFITGSHAYGEPTVLSDVDLCVLVDKGAELVLYQNCDNDSASIEESPEPGDISKEYSYTLRFGNLNLIHFTERWEFEAWQDSTALLVNWSYYNGPVSTLVATKIIRAEANRRKEQQCRSV